MDRDELIKQVSSRLRGRRLVWFGTRGDDAEPLTAIPEFSAAFTIINRYSHRGHIDAWSMEQFSGRRVDLDMYDIDDEPDVNAAAAFRRQVLSYLRQSSAVITYRPSRLLSSIAFARGTTCRYLGMFKDHQDAFEHKPWVESSLRERGVPCIGWTYIADEDQPDAEQLFGQGSVLLRLSRSSGGTGLVRVDDPADLRDLWPKEAEGYVSVAPYYEGGTPVNVGAVVWRDGITLHPGSLQLIGIEHSTNRTFGYCGNDFKAFGDLPTHTIELIEGNMFAIGRWLRNRGYLGAFGVDFLVVDDVPLFTEVNPRFQGSTHLSSQISMASGESCVLLDHLGACLGLRAPASNKLTDYVGYSNTSHLILHSPFDRARRFDIGFIDAALNAGAVRCDVLTNSALLTDPGAMIARLTIPASVTSTGYSLTGQWSALVDQWLRAYLQGPSDETETPQ